MLIALINILTRRNKAPETKQPKTLDEVIDWLDGELCEMDKRIIRDRLGRNYHLRRLILVTDKLVDFLDGDEKLAVIMMGRYRKYLLDLEGTSDRRSP